MKLETGQLKQVNEFVSFSFGKNRLKRCIERGLANGKLAEDLRELDDLKLKSRADAEAVCWGLRQFGSGRTKDLGDDMSALTGLFQEVEEEECDAVGVLREEGIPELLRLFDELGELQEKDKASHQLFILKILALYATTQGALKIIEAAQQPLEPDNYMWSVTLGSFKAGHPQNELLFGSLRDPLPEAFIGVALLDAANSCLIEGEEMAHPFDTAEGKERLRSLLTNEDSNTYSYAHSATAALPFISNPERDELLTAALQHPDIGVQIAAAWAAARLGREEGLRKLAAYCRDFKRAQTAKRYLRELGREDVIPSEANDPSFEALAEFAQWLAHPSELGRLPDELEIVDQRELAWPPERQPKPFWLIKFRAKDTTGLDEDDVECGLVGSVTFCFFSYKLAQRPAEDGYAVHCYWEMEQAGLIEESDVGDEQREYEALLKQWRGRWLENPTVLFVAELSPELKYPQRLVGLASGRIEGADGWVVLDGDRSQWYPKSDMPEEAYDSVVLKVHVGRHLLGFSLKADRKKFLPPPPAPKRPEQVIASYQKLLSEAQQWRGTEKAFEHFGPLGKHLDAYASALAQLGRGAEIRPTIGLLAPQWDHCSGCVELGSTAFKCGQVDLAEELLVKSREKCENWERNEEMGFLAEIWWGQGRREDGKTLLIECLRRLLDGSKEATGSDKQLFEEWFQNQRRSLLKLFPSDGHAALDANRIPSSTLG